MNKHIDAVGIVQDIDLEGLSSWRLSQDSDKLRKDVWSDFAYSLQSEYYQTDMENYKELKLLDTSGYSYTSTSGLEEFVKKNISKLNIALEYAKEFNNPMLVFRYLENEKYCIIGWGKTRQILPKEFVKVSLFQNFDLLTASEIQSKLLSSGDESMSSIANAISVPKDVSKKSLKISIENIQGQISSEKKKIENEIEEMRQALREKEQALREAMQVKVNELEKKKLEFEKQIFQLDYQLYLLKCLLGDSISVLHVRQGKRTPLDRPVVFYQKLRFLDEDFAKMSSLYGKVIEEKSYVERILKNDDEVFNTFCPTEKCVVLIKVSRDEVMYIRDETNYLERYKMSNGNRIAILIRDGENLWIVWTEEGKIWIKENFIFQAQPNLEITDSTKLDRDEVITDDNYLSNSLPWRQAFSRSFLIAILQGLSENNQILKFPEKVDFSIPNKYVIFSTADNQIADKKFGTLRDFMKAMNKCTNIGDMILPLKMIAGSFTEKDCWNNRWVENYDRGRGDKNRVRDCDIDDEIQRINHIDIPYDVDFLYDSSKHLEKMKLDPDCNLEALQKEELKTKEFFEALERMGNKNSLREGNILYIKKYQNARVGYVWKDTGTRWRLRSIHKLTYHPEKVDEYKYYVSVEKPQDPFSERIRKVKVCSNVQIYLDEFINVSYLSSTILKYFLESKNLGVIDGNYAYVVKYLRKALDYISNRENEEIILLNRTGCRDYSKIPNIDIFISHWKYCHELTVLTPRKAKKLVEYINNIENFDQEYKTICMSLPWLIKDKNG